MQSRGKVKLSANAEEVAQSRYYNNGEDWESCTHRVATSVASIETNKAEYIEKFHEMIYNMDFIPGGRVLRNAGKLKGSMLNCYHLPCQDSIEEIGQFYKDALILWSEGGGVGCNFSLLRPKGDAIQGKGGVTSGLVSWIEGADFIASRIETGGQRRAACLAAVDVSHPEIMDFIDAKTIHGAISHFNISVMVNDAFIEAVERNDEWELKFKQRSYRKVKARVIWDKIVSNMVQYAEPGLLNMDNMTKNNSWYFDPISGVNPCGEAVLGDYGACDLGSLVLPHFITGNINTNWQKLEKVIKQAVRFLDNVLDINQYSLRKIDEKVHNTRRIGLGVMGLADYLFAKQLRYGSPDAIAEVEKLVRFIRDVAYQASIELAVEKGAFPKFDAVMFSKASFVRKLPATLRMDIKQKGVRNVTLLSYAPTGTTSLIPECTSGIEPLMFKSYKRKDRIGERIYVHPFQMELIQSKKSAPPWFVDMSDLTPKDHFEVQSVIQKYVDGAVSKTINMPKGTTKNQLGTLLLEYIHDLKGVTVYIDGTRPGQVYNNISDIELEKHINKASDKVNVFLSETDVECNICQADKDGIMSCEIKSKSGVI